MIGDWKKKVDFDGSAARWEVILGFGGPEEIWMYKLQIFVNQLPAPRIAQNLASICVPQFIFRTLSIKSSKV